MSLLSLDFYFTVASIAAVASAVLAVKSKEDFYSAVLLGLTGLSTASLIALLGYGFVAVFHALVYVGATVMFVVFGVVLIGRTGGFEKKATPLALAASVALAASLLVLFAEVQRGAQSVAVDPSRLQGLLFQENPLAVVFLGLSLAVLVAAGVMLATGDGEVEG